MRDLLEFAVQFPFGYWADHDLESDRKIRNANYRSLEAAVKNETTERNRRTDAVRKSGVIAKIPS